MKPLVLQHGNYRRVLTEYSVSFLRYLLFLLKVSFKFVLNLVALVLYVLFVPIKVYKLESSEQLPREVNLRDEYQKHQHPPRPFC